MPSLIAGLLGQLATTANSEPGTTPMGPPPAINLIHDDYNVNSKLTAEVTDDGLAPSHFEVKGNRSAP